MFKQIVTRDKICLSSSFLWRSCRVCAPYGFVTKHLLELHRGWTEELCNQQPFLVSDWSRILGSAQLVSHVVGAVHQKEKLSQHSKSNCVLRVRVQLLVGVRYWNSFTCCDNSGISEVMTLKSPDGILPCLFSPFVNKSLCQFIFHYT